jgi:hypothetical protein
MASPHAPDTQARMRDTRDMRDPQAVQAAQAVQALQTLLVSVQAEPWAHDFFALLRRIDAGRPAARRKTPCAWDKHQSWTLLRRP